MGLTTILLNPRRRQCLGGITHLLTSTLLELLFSMLLAPVKVLFHTWFIVTIFFGVAIDWIPQRRVGSNDSLLTLARQFVWPTLIGVIAIIALNRLMPDLTMWLMPMMGGLALALPIAFVTSSERANRFLRKRDLFLICEEIDPVPLLCRLEQNFLPPS